MVRVLLTSLAFLTVAAPTGSKAAEHVLQQMRDDVQRGVEPTEEKSCDESRRPRECDDCDRDSPWRDFFGEMLLMGITSPFWGPPLWCRDDYSSITYLSCYPYQHEPAGFVLTDPLPDSDELFTWSLRVRGEYADDFSGLSRHGGRILWESRSRFGIDTSLDYWREALANNRHDDLWTGDANIVFRFAQSDSLMMRTGLGFNYLSADHGTNLGFNFTYGGDWLPIKPWIVSAEIDWGWIDNAGLFHGRTTVGVNIQSVEFYAGFDYHDVGSAQTRGFISGVQLWY